MSESQSDARFIALNQLVNELQLRLTALGQRLTAAEQQLAQQAGWFGFPSAAVVEIVPASITTNVTAGSEASPSTFTATVLIDSGTGFTSTGGTSVTGYNRAPGIAFTVSGTKSAWLWKRPSDGKYYLVAADC